MRKERIQIVGELATGEVLQMAVTGLAVVVGRAQCRCACAGLASGYGAVSQNGVVKV